MASAFALRLRARWLSSGPADSQPVASHTRNHMMLLTCERMLLCECMCTSLARLVCSVCVKRALYARARVQGAEQREGAQATQWRPRCAPPSCAMNAWEHKFWNSTFSETGAPKRRSSFNQYLVLGKKLLGRTLREQDGRTTRAATPQECLIVLRTRDA